VIVLSYEGILLISATVGLTTISRYISVRFYWVLSAALVVTVLVSGAFTLLGDYHDLVIISGIALLLSQLILLLSLTITTQSLTQAARLLLVAARSLIDNPSAIAWKYVVIAAIEELFWRGTIQRALGHNIFSVLFVALAFCLAHKSKSGTTMTKFIELFIFSLILGLAFSVTDNIYLVIIIHSLRNINLTSLKIGLNQMVIPAAQIKRHQQ